MKSATIFDRVKGKCDPEVLKVLIALNTDIASLKQSITELHKGLLANVSVLKEIAQGNAQLEAMVRHVGKQQGVTEKQFETVMSGDALEDDVATLEGH